MSIRLGSVYPGATRIATCSSLAWEHPGSVPFGYGLTAGLATQCLPGFERRFTYVTHTEFAWPLIRLPAGRVHGRPRGSIHATGVGDVVGRAPHKAVASPACRLRRLLVAQQVRITACAEPDKTLRDLIALWRSRIVSRRSAMATCGGRLRTGLCHGPRPRDSPRSFPSRHPRRRRCSPAGIAACGRNRGPDLLLGCMIPQLGRATPRVAREAALCLRGSRTGAA